MNFKLVSKENLGCAVLLSLVVVLSLSKIFNIFIDTHLGRVVLILFVLVISYLNNILGVVAVLFIIIILSGNNMFYREGFDTSVSDSTKSDSSKDIKKDSNEKDKTEVQKGDNTVNVMPKSSEMSMPATNMPSIPPTPPPSQNSSPIPSSLASPTTTEGFDIIGLENDIKKGKPSNSIPVNAFMKESQFVSAYEANPFKEEFASF